MTNDNGLKIPIAGLATNTGKICQTLHDFDSNFQLGVDTEVTPKNSLLVLFFLFSFSSVFSRVETSCKNGAWD